MIDIAGFEQYLYEEEMSQNTVKSYLHAVQQFAQHHAEISKGDLIAFKQEQLAKHKPATVNLRISALLAYCRYAKIPMKLKTVKLPKQTSIDNVITPEQLNALLRGLKQDNNRCWYVNILLLSRTGMRVSEALRVTKRDIIAGSVTMHTKDHMRTIYFPRSLVNLIRRDIEPLALSDPVMRCHRGRRTARSTKTVPIGSGKAVRNGMIYLAKRYGIPEEVMHPHSLRHFFAIEFLKRKNDIALLADLLGHSSVNMTRIYLRQSQEKQQDVVNETVDW